MDLLREKNSLGHLSVCDHSWRDDEHIYLSLKDIGEEMNEVWGLVFCEWMSEIGGLDQLNSCVGLVWVCD